MTITSDKAHRRHSSGYGVAFWQNNTAPNEEEANRAVVYVRQPNGTYPRFSFDLPAQRHDMEKLEFALITVFAAGVASAKAEIRDVLGISERC